MEPSATVCPVAGGSICVRKPTPAPFSCPQDLVLFLSSGKGRDARGGEAVRRYAGAWRSTASASSLLNSSLISLGRRLAFISGLTQASVT